MKHKIAAENEFGIYMEFNGVAQAELTLLLVSELVRIIKADANFGPDTVIEIAEMGTGSFWARLIIGLSAISGLNDTWELASKIAELLGKEDEVISQCTAQMIVEGGGAKVQLMTCTGTINVLRDQIPAVRQFDALPPNQISNWHDYFFKPIKPLNPPMEEMVTVTRIGDRMPRVDGRPVELLDGSVVFGTRQTPRSNVRFVDDPEDAVISVGAGLTREIDVMGQFEIGRLEGGGLAFRTGKSMFRVVIPDGVPVPSVGVPSSARVQLDRNNPDTLTLVASDVIEP